MYVPACNCKCEADPKTKRQLSSVPTSASPSFIQGYEPYMLALRKDMPQYDERLRGSHGARAIQALQASMLLSFAIVPKAFLMRAAPDIGDADRAFASPETEAEARPLTCQE